MKMKKFLAVSIILLFLGVAVAPSINQNVVKASIDDDLVEITTQACGIQGYKDTTVKLTREQYQNLEQYLVEFRARLNQTSTQEEAVPIFKDAVVELDKYGLLPKGMSVELTQKLVLNMYSYEKNGELFEKVLRKKLGNYCCLVCGSAVNSFSFGFLYPLRRLIEKIAYFFNDIIEPIGMFIWVLLEIILQLRTRVFPLYLCNELTFGFRISEYHSPRYTPSSGWIFSLGLLGIKIWDESYYGQIRQLTPLTDFVPTVYTYYTGIVGFTGLTLRTTYTNNTFLGSCLMINLGPSPP